ncbi:MAG: aminopeptidase P family N-terminal domain-containing protein [Eubacteriales bacterium]|nr:aminopeptidase P family N-terminal domain-containing protein [Eubacteriales bacterium]
MTVNEKISALRTLMKQHELYAYYIGTADPHNSEYIADHFRSRAFMSGFAGSAGTLVVTLDQALLWVDGRYHIQAAKDVKDSEIILMKMGAPGVPKTLDWLADNLPQASKLAIAGDLHPDNEIAHMALSLSRKDISLVTDLDLVDEIWEDRPPLPQGKVKSHPLKYAGQSTADKISELRTQMKDDLADAAFYVGLDDIMWLMNLRGEDIPGNPVALSYALIEKEKTSLFINLNNLEAGVVETLAEQGVTLAPYDSVREALSELEADRIVLDRRRVSRSLVEALPKDSKVIVKNDYLQVMKAKLNDIQQKSQLEAGKRDSAYVTSYLYFVKHKAVELGHNEYSVTEELERLRSQDPLYIEASFSTISAYGANAAMMHYQAGEDSYAELEARGLYLVDCGAQMWDGTTDITRTIALGELTQAEKEAYTLTLRSHIALASLPFLKGSSGVALDAVARSVVWRENFDYKCGTGHGVGYVAGVHEGPQRLTASTEAGKQTFEPGMVITIEPGVYLEGILGVRLENDYIVVHSDFETNSQGDVFYSFKPFTFVPFDRDAILVEKMTAGELSWLNDYHAKVREVLLPLLTAEAVKEYVLRETEAFPLEV